MKLNQPFDRLKAFGKWGRRVMLALLAWVGLMPLQVSGAEKLFSDLRLSGTSTVSSGAVLNVEGTLGVTGTFNAPSSFTLGFDKVTSKPTTLSGYGITDAQGLDADLTSIAALSTQSFGRSLLTQADAGAARTTLGVAIGTDVLAPVSTGKTLWVDSVNGNDGTGLRAREDRPFATIQAAIAAASPGDVVQIGPGTWTIADSFEVGGITLAGKGSETRIYRETAGSMVRITGDNTHLRNLVIDGYSPIEIFGESEPWVISLDGVRTQNGIDCIVGYDFPGQIDISNCDLTSSYDLIASSGFSSATITVRGSRLYSSGAGGISAYGNVFISGCDVTAFRPFWVIGGNLSVSGSRISVIETGELGIVESGTFKVAGCVVDGSANIQGLTVNGGVVELTGVKIDTSGNASSNPLTKSGGTVTLRGCTLVAEGTRDSIEAGTAQTVDAVGSVANRAPDANVSISTVGGLVHPSAIPVTTSASQTLSGKTLSSPVVSGSLSFSSFTDAVSAKTAWGRQIAIKSSDTSRTSTTTMTADPHLSLPVVASATYRFYGYVAINVTHATPGLKIGIQGPGTPTAVLYEMAYGSVNQQVFNAFGGWPSGWASTGNSMAMAIGTPADSYLVRFSGTFTNGATAGTLSIDWAQNTSSANASPVLKRGSWLELERIQ